LVIGGDYCQEDGPCNAVPSVDVVRHPPGNDDCQDIQPYPMEISGGTAAYYNNKVLVCGGDDIGRIWTDKCYELLSSSHGWREIKPLPYRLTRMASSIIGGKWLLSGGRGDPSGSGSKTLVFEDGIFTPGPELPEELYAHCQLTLNSSHVFFAGHAHTFVLDWPRQEWAILESLPSTMNFAACGLLENSFYGPGKRH